MLTRCGFAFGVASLAGFQALANDTNTRPGGASVGATASAKTTIRTGARLSWSLDETLRIVDSDPAQRHDITRHKVIREEPVSDGQSAPHRREIYYVDFS